MTHPHPCNLYNIYTSQNVYPHQKILNSSKNTATGVMRKVIYDDSNPAWGCYGDLKFLILFYLRTLRRKVCTFTINEKFVYVRLHLQRGVVVKFNIIRSSQSKHYDNARTLHTIFSCHSDWVKRIKFPTYQWNGIRHDSTVVGRLFQNSYREIVQWELILMNVSSMHR